MRHTPGIPCASMQLRRCFFLRLFLCMRILLLRCSDRRCSSLLGVALAAKIVEEGLRLPLRPRQRFLVGCMRLSAPRLPAPCPLCTCIRRPRQQQRRRLLQ
jgi:hypothetical protein